MGVALSERKGLLVAAGLAGAALLGGIAGLQPMQALALAGAALIVLAAVRTPTVSLALLIFLTAVVPYGLQNQLGVGGGQNSPGLLLSDVLLLLGLGVGALLLHEQELSRRERVAVTLLSVFLAIVVLQLVHGIQSGGSVSEAGAELRTLLGFSTYLIALPLLHHPTARRRLLVALLGLALVLGVWGILQWFGHFSFGGDVGIRQGVRLTAGGKGQLQGGLYGYPVAVVCCYAVLLGGWVRSIAGRAILWVALILNAVSLLLTFERTFWIATLAGIFVATLKANASRRLKGLVLLPLVSIVFFSALAVVAPTELSTARERLLSINQYGTDDSLRYRVVESDHVMAQIRQHPVAGSGLGATIYWGQAWAQVPPKTYTYSHDGYLWLAWKIGIPGAAILVLLLGAAALLRGPPGEDLRARSIRSGAQSALIALLIVCVTFPSFNALSITPMIGVLLALALAPLTTRAQT